MSFFGGYDTCIVHGYIWKKWLFEFFFGQGAFICSILATENSSALIRETQAKPTKNSICDTTGTPC